MSALTNPVPAQPVQQPPKRIVPVPQEPPRQPSSWKGWLMAALVAAGGFAAYQQWLKPAAQAPQATIVYRTAKVTAGTFQRVLRVAGTTAAKQYVRVSVPRQRGPESRNMLELLKLVKDGTWVKRGDLMAEIDAGSLLDHVDDIKSSIVQAELDVDKRKSEQGVEMDTLRQTVLVAKAQLDKAKLERSAADVRTEVERELLKLDEEEADARYKQVQLDLPQKAIVHDAEVKILGHTTDRHQRHAGRHINDIKAFTINSPMEGLVVIQSMFRGGEFAKIQQGDQVMPGQEILRVVNPKSMQIEANANQAETSEIRIGQKAMIGLDAFPGLKLTGKVYSIGALAVGGWRSNQYIRTVPVKLDIDGADARVIPDLSSFADIVVEEKPDSTLIPLGAIREERGKNYVFVKQGEQFVKREVTLGSKNYLHAVALSGVKAGDELRLD
ncbi:MAG: HlyD family efflux transporter periplasmic adaptor subunit [Bryobacteraceae bacterium]|nr:HlyD family efflux transporter periplasmic adaptor subunit [Bryobacteraceae bacterium]